MILSIVLLIYGFGGNLSRICAIRRGCVGRGGAKKAIEILAEIFSSPKSIILPRAWRGRRLGFLTGNIPKLFYPRLVARARRRLKINLAGATRRALIGAIGSPGASRSRRAFFCNEF